MEHCGPFLGIIWEGKSPYGYAMGHLFHTFHGMGDVWDGKSKFQVVWADYGKTIAI